MKRNSKGFTLVELIVSVAIMGLIALIAMGFMTTGARTYTAVGYTLRLQYESQLAMAQLQDAMMDCNTGIVWDGSTLSILNTDSQNPDNDELKLFRYDSAEQCIYYGSNSPHAATLLAEDLLAEHVSAFSVSFRPGAETNHVKLADLELTFQRRSKTHTGSQSVALRNQPLTAASVSDLLDAVYP
ncbi:type II secretion system protein J [Oscillibacter sp.]|uniref:PulJ/GspJ family protein n=1 Tax=Oscillibacter sp. TaxID=1945593 RepID=UPI002618CAD6|nr:prepilin-type N-terminal cleavage/methylation domain-containing protein [Oscillibacter sp.]MDD3347402.1 prepilin-type N-terminal cleavage/methylation domain-containing protein [Oscillibacter sp.]